MQTFNSSEELTSVKSLCWIRECALTADCKIVPSCRKASQAPQPTWCWKSSQLGNLSIDQQGLKAFWNARELLEPANQQGEQWEFWNGRELCIIGAILCPTKSSQSQSGPWSHSFPSCYNLLAQDTKIITWWFVATEDANVCSRAPSGYHLLPRCQKMIICCYCWWKFMLQGLLPSHPSRHARPSQVIHMPHHECHFRLTILKY